LLQPGRRDRAPQLRIVPLYPSPSGFAAVRAEHLMNTKQILAPSWSTAAFGDAAGTSPLELSALEDHLDLCKGSHGRLFALHCAVEALNGFVAARFVTTLAVVVLLIGVATLVL
jgi:hypothetical protein